MDSRLILHTLRGGFTHKKKRNEEFKLSYEDINVIKNVFGKKEDKHPYIDGLKNICVRIIKCGSKFRINEYDGTESVEILDENKYIVA